jgi:hypothetical protein
MSVVTKGKRHVQRKIAEGLSSNEGKGVSRFFMLFVWGGVGGGVDERGWRRLWVREGVNMVRGREGGVEKRMTEVERERYPQSIPT